MKFCDVQLEDSQRTIRLVWPSSDISYCNDKLEGRNCPQDSINPLIDNNNDNTFNLKINFGPIDINGYLLDKGLEYGMRDSGYEYGW